MAFTEQTFQPGPTGATAVWQGHTGTAYEYPPEPLAPSGLIHASAIAPDSADSMYLFKMSQRAIAQRPAKSTDHPTEVVRNLYYAVLGGPAPEVDAVIAHPGVWNSQVWATYDRYDPKTYTGQCKKAVEAFLAVPAVTTVVNPLTPHYGP